MPSAPGGSGRSAPAPAAGQPPRVIVVVVTYNRRDLLLEALSAVLAQTRPADAVIVVDNASTDGAAAAVRRQFPSVQLAELARNTGGAGGFACGIALALDESADLVWLMDDDTVPEPGALQALLEARERHPAYPARPPVLLASRVVWTDGRAHPMNTPRAKPFAGRAEREAAAAAGCVQIRSASFVSVLVDAGVCRERGLPQADYFLWNDDFEFTTRVLRGNVGLLCPASTVVHKTAVFGATDNDPGERFFYEVRNKIWTLRARAPLAPLERVLYGGSTLRRWARTFAKSPDRRALGQCLVRGAAAGVRTSPRPTGEILAAAGLKSPVP
jgi:rhamnopyranosyl-N-acetylglucosaminyl-diphospho-decaprenol beta-1,3/1,4-galactofuranosyltransferase